VEVDLGLVGLADVLEWSEANKSSSVSMVSSSYPRGFPVDFVGLVSSEVTVKEDLGLAFVKGFFGTSKSSTEEMSESSISSAGTTFETLGGVRCDLVGCEGALDLVLVVGGVRDLGERPDFFSIATTSTSGIFSSLSSRILRRVELDEALESLGGVLVGVPPRGDEALFDGLLASGVLLEVALVAFGEEGDGDGNGDGDGEGEVSLLSDKVRRVRADGGGDR